MLAQIYYDCMAISCLAKKWNNVEKVPRRKTEQNLRALTRHTVFLLLLFLFFLLTVYNLAFASLRKHTHTHKHKQKRTYDSCKKKNVYVRQFAFFAPLNKSLQLTLKGASTGKEEKCPQKSRNKKLILIFQVNYHTRAKNSRMCVPSFHHHCADWEPEEKEWLFAFCLVQI